MNKNSKKYKEFRRKANIRNRRYYNKPEIKIKKRIYRKEYDKINKEKIRERYKKYCLKPEVQARIKKWRKDNKEHLREYARRPENKKKKRKSDRLYREKNKEKLKTYRAKPEVRARHKEQYEKNREHLKQVRKKYYKTKQGKLSVIRCNHRKLALRKERPTDLTREKIDKIFKRDKVCVYCGSNKNLELDHIIPLKLGGTSLFNNFVLACSSCNRSKHGRDVFKWCKLQNIKVPKIVIECLNKQKKYN